MFTPTVTYDIHPEDMSANFYKFAPNSIVKLK